MYIGVKGKHPLFKSNFIETGIF